MHPIDGRLSQAIVLYTGMGLPGVSYPQRDEGRVAETSGSDLLPVIHELEAEFYRSSARSVAHSLKEMGDLARDEFQARHPELSLAAVEAFVWCYTFDNK